MSSGTRRRSPARPGSPDFRPPEGQHARPPNALLAASGWALSYLVGEAWRPALGWVHAAAGAMACLLGALHQRGGGGRPRR